MYLPRRELVAQNPATYWPELAATLNNLGKLYRDMRRFAEAEAAYKEAVAIQRELAAQKPSSYRPHLAGTPNNLGVLYRRTPRFDDAQAAYREARGYRARIGRTEPRRLRPDPAQGSTTSLLFTGTCTATATRGL
jgi:tetratricopeptide (TPR) repeat protein